MGKAMVINGLTVSNPLCTVTFNASVESITLDNSTLTIDAGSTGTLTATVTTSDSSSVAATFTSSDTSVATISASNNVATITAIQGGSATITVTAGSISVTCALTVNATAESELADFYEANTSITDEEKTALETLVDTLIDNGLWSKIKYFCPMVGTTADDQIIDVKHTDSSLFIDSSQYTYTDGVLQFATVSGASAGSSALPENLSTDSISIIAGVNFVGTPQNSLVVKFLNADSSVSIESLASYGGYRVPRLDFAGTAYASTTSVASILERKIIYTYDGTDVRITLNGDVIYTTSAEITAEALTLKRQHPFNCTGQDDDNKAYATFLAVATALTSTEETALNTALNTFLVAIGKIS